MGPYGPHGWAPWPMESGQTIATPTTWLFQDDMVCEIPTTWYLPDDLDPIYTYTHTHINIHIDAFSEICNGNILSRRDGSH